MARGRTLDCSHYVEESASNPLRKVRLHVHGGTQDAQHLCPPAGRVLTTAPAAGAADLEALAGDRHLDHWTTLLTMQRDGAQQEG